jgi:hypothetical protein
MFEAEHPPSAKKENDSKKDQIDEKKAYISAKVTLLRIEAE